MTQQPQRRVRFVVEVDSRDAAGNTRVDKIPIPQGTDDGPLPILTGVAITLDGEVLFAKGLTGDRFDRGDR